MSAMTTTRQPLCQAAWASFGALLADWQSSVGCTALLWGGGIVGQCRIRLGKGMWAEPTTRSLGAAKPACLPLLQADGRVVLGCSKA